MQQCGLACRVRVVSPGRRADVHLADQARVGTRPLSHFKRIRRLLGCVVLCLLTRCSEDRPSLGKECSCLTATRVRCVAVSRGGLRVAVEHPEAVLGPSRVHTRVQAMLGGSSCRNVQQPVTCPGYEVRGLDIRLPRRGSPMMMLNSGVLLFHGVSSFRGFRAFFREMFARDVGESTKRGCVPLFWAWLRGLDPTETGPNRSAL